MRLLGNIRQTKAPSAPGSARGFLKSRTVRRCKPPAEPGANCPACTSAVKKLRKPHAFTLLEIILALAILAGALAALGEVMRAADQNAAMTGDETEAQIIASTLMDELACGARQITAVQKADYDTSTVPGWSYTIELQDTGMQELIGVHVRVELKVASNLNPADFDLVRWLPNPDYVAPTSQEESSTATDGSSSSSNSGSSSSSANVSGAVQ